jgi:protein subunit release factor B
MMGSMNVEPGIPPLEQLAEECDFEAFRSSGPGGQNVNRRATAVRLTHRPSGIAVTCQEERSQLRNRQLALEKLRERLIARAKRRKPRKKTGKPRAVREKILETKKRTGEKKSLRRKPATD